MKLPTPSTTRLLVEFVKSRNHFLSKEDIRQDVIFDDDAREGSIRTLIYVARKELSDSPYRIETIARRGYRLHRIDDNPIESEVLLSRLEESSVWWS